MNQIHESLACNQKEGQYYLGMYLRELKTNIHTKTCTYILRVILLIIDKKWKQPKCPSTDEWINKMGYTYTIDTCYNMDEPEGHNAKLNKPDKERKIQHVLSYMWNVKSLMT